MWKRMRRFSLKFARCAACLACAASLQPLDVQAQAAVSAAASATAGADNPDARPPASPVDLQIVQRARKLLDSPAKWNRADNRKCPADAKTFSLYCALETATIESGQKFEHRGAALQEMRFVIDEITAERDYDHRLMDYNNDPATTFADIQEVFRITESLIELRLKSARPATTVPASP
jgi:hypothetical protein